MIYTTPFGHIIALDHLKVITKIAILPDIHGAGSVNNDFDPGYVCQMIFTDIVTPIKLFGRMTNEEISLLPTRTSSYGGQVKDWRVANDQECYKAFESYIIFKSKIDRIIAAWIHSKKLGYVHDSQI